MQEITTELKNRLQEALPGKKVYVQKLKPPFNIVAVYVPSGISLEDELQLVAHENFNMINATTGIYVIE